VVTLRGTHPWCDTDIGTQRWIHLTGSGPLVGLFARTRHPISSRCIGNRVGYDFAQQTWENHALCRNCDGRCYGDRWGDVGDGSLRDDCQPATIFLGGFRIVNRPSTFPLLMAAAGVLLAAVAIFGILQNRFIGESLSPVAVSTRQPDGDNTSQKYSQAGAPAPDFELFSLEGSSKHLSDFAGHPILINYWATWCPPCREELPLIQDRLDRYSPDLVVLTINAGEEIETVRNYIEHENFSFQVLLDPEWKAEALYGIYAYPTTVFIDRDGLIQARYVGGLSEEILDEYLKLIGVYE
jgi:peroxiredoxin